MGQRQVAQRVVCEEEQPGRLQVVQSRQEVKNGSCLAVTCWSLVLDLLGGAERDAVDSWCWVMPRTALTLWEGTNRINIIEESI